jgi:hypothetical protein
MGFDPREARPGDLGICITLFAFFIWAEVWFMTFVDDWNWAFIDSQNSRFFYTLGWPYNAI